jgi:hypothetical protein
VHPAAPVLSKLGVLFRRLFLVSHFLSHYDLGRSIRSSAVLRRLFGCRTRSPGTNICLSRYSCIYHPDQCSPETTDVGGSSSSCTNRCCGSPKSITFHRQRRLYSSLIDKLVSYDLIGRLRLSSRRARCVFTSSKVLLIDSDRYGSRHPFLC